MENLETKELETLTNSIVENVKSSVAEMQKETETQISDIKEEVKWLKAYMQKDAKANLDVKEAHAVIATSFKQAYLNGVTSEAGFNSIFDANIKATYQNTITATDGKEFVFDLFSRDVFYVFERNEVVKELNAKRVNGKSITLPTYDGGVEAYWVGEGEPYTQSKWNTGEVKVELKKLGALVTFTDEMLADDMTTETLYWLIVEDVAVKFAKKTENGIINGEGGYAGILTAANLNTTTVSSLDAITDADIVTAKNKITNGYKGNNDGDIIIATPAVYTALEVMRDVNGNLTYPELRNEGKLFRRRVLQSDVLPATVGLIFGNIRDFYWALERWDYEAVMGYDIGDFQQGKKSLRVSERKWGAPKTGKAFSVIATA